ncbi:MAG: tetratricopeptide repeat protein, partial [bacterium]
MKRSLDRSGERPPITGTSKEVPPTWRSAIPVPESDSLLLRQSELDRARSEYRLGHYKEVLADLLKLIAKLEQFFTRTEFSADAIPYHLLYASTWATLGHTYRVLRLDENAATAFERAVREFQEWIPRSTEEVAVGIHCDYGISLSEMGRIAEAIQAFESGAKNGALSSEGYRYYAESVGKQEHVSHEQLLFAETQLRESLNLDSNDPLTHRALARNLEAQGKVDKALDCLRRAAALMVVNDKLAEAEATIGDALRLAPNDAHALGIRGGILVIMGRNGEALTVLEQSLTIAPDSGWVLGAKGQALAALGRDTEALDSLQHALQADSSLSWVHFESGVVLNKFGRNAEALQALDEAIKLSADYAMAFALKGYVLLDLDRREEAIDAFFQAVHLDPSLDWVAVKLAETLSVLRRYDEALGVLNQELELQTTNVVALRGTKADVLWDMGRHEEALKTLDQTLSL